MFLQSANTMLDPVAYLPAELVSHVFSFLNPASLVQLEAVSKSWNKAASSHHVWRNVFRQKYGFRSSGLSSSSTATRKIQSAGLGKTLPNQDWKKMAMVRRALDQRWKDGKAAAIYLKGHTDTVYCVQFDEYVDFTYLDVAIADCTVTDIRSSLGRAIALFAFGMPITRGHV